MANLTAYGFIEIKDLFSQRIITIGGETLQTALEASLVEHTRQITAMLSGLVMKTTEFQFRYQLPAGGSLQPLDEKGNPKVVVPSGFYNVALPIQGAGTAWGDDRVSRAAMTFADANRYTIDALERDADWMRRHILAALFTNVTWPYTDARYGSLTIQPLANNDGVGYVLRGGSLDTAQNHFLAQAAALSDAANPFPTIYRALDEHPSNSGPYIAYIPTNLVSAAQLMTSTLPPQFTNLNYASTVTLSKALLNPDDTLRGDGPDIGFGDRYIGINSNMILVEWTSLPDNYIVAVASGASEIVGMREWEFPELQGLFPEYFTPDGNLQVNRMIRYAGFGIVNRVGAVIDRIGNGAYAIPTGYTAPLVA